jgi:hypothetical protein
VSGYTVSDGHFINVHLAYSAGDFYKNTQKYACDCYALKRVFRLKKL